MTSEVCIGDLPQDVMRNLSKLNGHASKSLTSGDI
jgi:hypothetical protein